MADDSLVPVDMQDEQDEADGAGTILSGNTNVLEPSPGILTDPIPPELAEYYKRQTQLLTLQAEHLHEQRNLTLAHLRVRQFSDRFKTVSQLVVAFLAIMLAVGVIILICNASASRAIVLDQFDVPPELARVGFSGKVVAAQVIDALNRVNAVESDRPSEVTAFSGAWSSDDLRLAIPDTGLSLSDIDRFLRIHLGQDTHITGDVVEIGDPSGNNTSLQLTVRGDGLLPKTFFEQAEDPKALLKLTTEAGEYLYGESSPLKFAQYLDLNGRFAEEVAFCKQAFHSVSNDDLKAALLKQWGEASANAGGSQSESLVLFKKALQYRPNLWSAYNDAMDALWALGQEEEAWRLGVTMQDKANGRPGRATEVDYENWDELTWNLMPWRNAVSEDERVHSDIGTNTMNSDIILADIDWRLHDFADAEFRLTTARKIENDEAAEGLTHFVRSQLALATGDIAASVTEMRLFRAAYQRASLAANDPGYLCWAALPEAKIGKIDEALADLAKQGSFVDCYRFRADLLDQKGDWSSAQAWYQRAIALAPDLPAGYYSRGLAMLRHGNIESAMADFSEAMKKGPHWADPAKAAGDILWRDGKREAAMQHYKEALKWAPAWRELKEKHDSLAAELLAARQAR
jgi:tetratricopeptide (TPR) repeat protein